MIRLLRPLVTLLGCATLLVGCEYYAEHVDLAATVDGGACGAGITSCGGACVDTKLDPSNCGACGTQCADGQVCALGACAVACPTGLVDCAASCVDPTSDAEHCGATAGCGAGDAGTSGTSCASGQVCTAGTCSAAACPANYGDCDGVAANGCESQLLTDDANCGACANACTGSNKCHDGTCEAPSVLIIAAEDIDYVNEVSVALEMTALFSTVSFFDLTFDTPTVAQMKAYDVVLVWADYAPDDPAALGDNLASYFDEGGNIVYASFLPAPVPSGGYSDTLDGRFATDPGYLTVSGYNVDAVDPATLVVNDATSPLLANVTMVNTNYRVAENLDTGATDVADSATQNGVYGNLPLVSYSRYADRYIVNVNLWPPQMEDQATGDGYVLLANALLFAH